MKRSFGTLQLESATVIQGVNIYIETKNGQSSDFNYALAKYNGAWYRTTFEIPRTIIDIMYSHFNISLLGNKFIMDPRQPHAFKQIIFIRNDTIENPVLIITGEPHCVLRDDIKIDAKILTCNDLEYNIPEPAREIIVKSCDFVQIRGHTLLIRSFKKTLPINRLLLANHHLLPESDGEIHLLGGTSIQVKDGNIYHYHLGKLHRKDRPAVENANGSELWYDHGIIKKSAHPIANGQWAPIQTMAKK